jgi:hypothetical protein
MQLLNSCITQVAHNYVYCIYVDSIYGIIYILYISIILRGHAYGDMCQFLNPIDYLFLD